MYMFTHSRDWWPFFSFHFTFFSESLLLQLKKKKKRDSWLDWLRFGTKRVLEIERSLKGPRRVLREVFLFTHQGCVCGLLVRHEGCSRAREKEERRGRRRNRRRQRHRLRRGAQQLPIILGGEDIADAEAASVCDVLSVVGNEMKKEELKVVCRPKTNVKRNSWWDLNCRKSLRAKNGE